MPALGKLYENITLGIEEYTGDLVVDEIRLGPDIRLYTRGKALLQSCLRSTAMFKASSALYDIELCLDSSTPLPIAV